MSDAGILVPVAPADPAGAVAFQWRPRGFRAGGQARIATTDRDLAPPSTRFDGVDIHTFVLEALWDARRGSGTSPGPTCDSIRQRLHALTLPVGGPDSGQPPPVVRYVPWGTGLDWTVTADWAGAEIAHRPSDGAIMAIQITLTLLQHRPQQASGSVVTTPTAPQPDFRPNGDTYVIVSGDTLAGIAGRIYGDANLWRLIWDANKDTLRSGDPDLIFPGETIVIPPKP